MRKPSASGSSGSNEAMSVCAWDASIRPGAKGTTTSCPAFLAAASTAALPASTIRSASEILLPPDWPALKLVRMPSSASSTCAS